MVQSIFIFSSHLSTQCFPLPETWYVVYRNYPEDPKMGGTAKCVRGTQSGPRKNNVVPIFLQHGPSATG